MLHSLSLWFSELMQISCPLRKWRICISLDDCLGSSRVDIWANNSWLIWSIVIPIFVEQVPFRCPIVKSIPNYIPMKGENQVVPDGSVKVRRLQENNWSISRGNCRICLISLKKNQKITTCNRLDLETLGSLTDYDQTSPWTLWLSDFQPFHIME